jgi:uncharacterized protein involved in response to NO
VLPDPAPERKLARLLAAYIVAGLVFMVLPGTVLGVWNLIGISSERAMAAVSPAWVQAHGHAQFFGWFGTFVIGISLYTLPKFRGATLRSVSAGWLIWAFWTAGVGLRWLAGIQTHAVAAEFRMAAMLELSVGVLLLWQVLPSSRKQWKGQAWELPIYAGFVALVAALAWQFALTMSPFTSPALPAAPNQALISIAVWTFAFPVVIGYCAKFFPGLLGSRPASVHGLRLMLLPLPAAAVSAGAIAFSVTVALWSLRVFLPTKPTAKAPGKFAHLAFVWLSVSALLNFAVPRPGMLGASRHAFTVGFLATLIFAIGPRILPSFVNSRELWSVRLTRWSLLLLTAGCTLRVVSEPLAYGGISTLAWRALPVSAILELAAVLMFVLNLAMSLATPIPSWFGRKHVTDRMTIYWLTASYPATRRILIENGLATLGRAHDIPRSLTLREAAEADRITPDLLIAKLGDFFESRLARSGRRSDHV